MTTAEFQEFVPGELLIDGDVRGRYAGQAMQELAASYGWDGTYLDADSEFYNEAQDDAEEYLNNRFAREGNYFHWNMGSFFYGTYEE
jgi:hypothetical protein